ncbi:MAG: hypothetical protein ACK49M_04975 [Actinomycetes bacterium]|jgi:hypothetical protein
MDESFALLSELTRVEDFLEDPVFADVSQAGETYTSYRVVRITHEAIDHPEGWTHLANVTRARDGATGVARLRIVDRHIKESRVTHPR